MFMGAALTFISLLLAMRVLTGFSAGKS
jgi:hypothetical protein